MRLRTLVALAAIAATAAAEDDEPRTVREGNLVEYFGKEKVDQVVEGETLHVFREALCVGLRGRGFGFASGATPPDEAMERFLAKEPGQVEEGDAFGVSARGEPVVWERIEADDESTFNDRRLRSGLLRVAYESESERDVLLEVAGPTWVIANGVPRVGDHYNFGYTLLPMRLRQGLNEIVMNGGRFPEMRVRLIQPATPVLFNTRRVTVPDLLRDQPQELHAAVGVLNTTETAIEGYTIVCSHGGESRSTPVPSTPPRSSVNSPLLTPLVESIDAGAEQVTFELSLIDEQGHSVAREELTLDVRSSRDKHRRTFLSAIDGSVQYFAVTPPSVEGLEEPALFLSVHGASVEAMNQARAYGHKDWGYLVAPTNRGPFGYAWEDWGRLDALEVLDHAERLFATDPRRTYLTGHSMGGHGSWYLGAVYPSRFAAVAPCAGYPDLLAYRDGFRERLRSMSREDRERMGISDERLEQLLNEPAPARLEQMMLRAGAPSRTLSFLENHKQHALYILHGEADTVVPTEIARDARRRVGEFHNDFTYYEYPGGTHWYGDESVDWPPIFDLFRAREVPDPAEVDRFTFATASPGVSATSRGVTIEQQSEPLRLSRIEFTRDGDNSAELKTENVAALVVDAGELAIAKLTVDGAEIAFAEGEKQLRLRSADGGWTLADEPLPRSQKGPHRYGGFKDAFRHRVLFVYGTQGESSAAEWAFNKARFDAEEFTYRANARVEVIADKAFKPTEYADRSVILYGNRDTNSAWTDLLGDCPLQVREGELRLGEARLTGDGWGAYFVYPRPDSDVASVGVVAATGSTGRAAATANQYLVNGNGFPDLTIFDSGLLTYGAQALKCAGYWGQDWSIENGDIQWR